MIRQMTTSRCVPSISVASRHAHRSLSTTTKLHRSERRATVNQTYVPQHKPLPTLQPKAIASGTSYSDAHHESQWDDATIEALLQKHCMVAWGAQNAMLPNVAKTMRRGDGCYLYDSNGKKYIDFSSQAVCVNFGHTIPPSVKQAIDDQLDSVSYLYGGVAVHEIRARLCALLSEVCPGDINGFMFPSSGSEANECAIRMARKYTGRKKIFSRYRSYHGGTLGSLAMTGDSRRFDVDKDIAGFVKFLDPFPMFFQWGNSDASEDEIAEKALQSLHEQILLENPNDIAAICIEPITGANGWLKPPVKYVQGIRALCDQYGILLICDEVMAGFGRTGKMFSFEHFEGVQPDIMTFAKGLTGSFLPLSGVGITDKLMEFFRSTPIGYGSTFQAHPVAMACGYAVVKYLLDEHLVSHAQQMEGVIKSHMQSLLDDCPESVAQARVYGMAGCVDIRNPETNDIICSTNETHPKLAELKKNLNHNGLLTLIRGPVLHITPPLIAEAEDIEYGFDILRKSLKDTF